MIHSEPILCIVKRAVDLRTPEQVDSGVTMTEQYVRYEIIANFPEGATTFGNVRLNGWRPPPPLEVTPRSAGSEILCMRVNGILCFPVDEWPAFGPCRSNP